MERIQLLLSYTPYLTNSLLQNYIYTCTRLTTSTREKRGSDQAGTALALKNEEGGLRAETLPEWRENRVGI